MTHWSVLGLASALWLGGPVFASDLPVGEPEASEDLGADEAPRWPIGEDGERMVPSAVYRRPVVPTAWVPTRPLAVTPAVTLEAPPELAVRRPRPWRATAWIAAEQATLITLDSIFRPPTWDRPTFDNFLDAFRYGPRAVDEDGVLMNFVFHPLMGGHFYMAGRNNGLSVGGSALAAVLGTLSWEFVVESWYERPVTLDVLITPGLGIPVGMVLSMAKGRIRSIRHPTLRFFAMLPIDPIEAFDDVLYDGPPYRARY